MFTKAIAKALVIVLTVGMTSLITPVSRAMTQADSLTISAATHSQSVGETATPSSPVATVSFLGENRGDTYSVTVSLVSAPAGNTRLPVLRLIETVSSIVFTTDSLNPLIVNSVISASTQAKVSPSTTGAAIAGARFQVYLDSPTVVGTYVVRLTPAVVGGGGVANATGQNLTITVGSQLPPSEPTPTAPYVIPNETSTPDTYTAYLTITTARPTQLTNQSQTTSDLFVSLFSYANDYGDTFSVSASLVSAPAGNTSLPILERVGQGNSQTLPAVITPQVGGFGGYAVIDARDNHVCGVVVSASSDPFNNGGYMSQEYMGCPAGSRFVFQTFPSESGNVAGWHGSDVILIGNTFSLPGGRTLTNGIVTDPDGRKWHSGTGVTVSSSSDTTTPAPTNIRVRDAFPGGNSINVGDTITTMNAFITPVIVPGPMVAVFKLSLNNPKKIGTYVIKVIPRVIGGTGTAPTRGLIITLTVTRDPSTYPVSGDVTLSRPGDISNKSDALISAPSTFDGTTEVAVIRTVQRTTLGQITTTDSLTATIVGSGLLGTAPLSSNINVTSLGRSIQVRAGDAVTVYGDGTVGSGTVIISNYDGSVLGTKTVNFVDLANQASAILALSFSSFPEKGTPMQLTALVNLSGTVRFTTNGKTLGSCARVTATGSPKTAICQWKPPLAGSINVVARFTPTDTQITPASTTKVLAIARRSGRR